MFKVNKKYHVQQEQKLVSEKGKKEIAHILGRNSIYIPLESVSDGDELVNEKGKIAKRIANNIRRDYDRKLSTDVISEIGNIANNNCIPVGDFTIIVSNNLWIWDSFNDDLTTNLDSGNRSCFGPGKQYHSCWLAMDAHPDYFCLKVYKDDEFIARAWLFRHDSYLAVFNAYGLHINIMSSLLATALGGESYRVTVTDSDMYINSDIANLVVPKSSEKKEHFIILYSGVGDHNVCEACGDTISEDDTQYVFGDAYCSSCFNERFFYCDDCGEVYSLDNYAENGLCTGCYEEE
jgi:hypothetical protein